MTSPLDRRADPLTTPAMTEGDIDLLWRWVRTGIANDEFDLATAIGIATLLREIDRARAVEKAVEAGLLAPPTWSVR
jgi:hypothetical protein